MNHSYVDYKEGIFVDYEYYDASNILYYIRENIEVFTLDFEVGKTMLSNELREYVKYNTDKIEILRFFIEKEIGDTAYNMSQKELWKYYDNKLHQYYTFALRKFVKKENI